jgi:acetyltransferase-like isoleucine patch superfamily enzyme
MQKLLIAFKILTNIKFYWFVLSDVFSYFNKIVRKYEMLILRGNVKLGKNTYIAKSTDLLAPLGTSIWIGDETTINGNCIIIGNVKIERYCLLAYNIYISSGNHQAVLFPEWLIRDQDEEFSKINSQSNPHDNQVHIEEDCWIGWGVFINRGVYIGKGAVIGASTVVTRDVPPYSIQVGAPNKQLSTRLNFNPPTYLDARKQEHWPYFYCGFLIKQSQIKESIQSEMLIASKVVRLIMKGDELRSISLSGELINNVKQIKLELKCNGVKFCEVMINSQKFDLVCDTTSLYRSHTKISQSIVLSEHNEIEITSSLLPSKSSQPEHLYGLKTISIS